MGMPTMSFKMALKTCFATGLVLQWGFTSGFSLHQSRWIVRRHNTQLKESVAAAAEFPKSGQASKFVTQQKKKKVDFEVSAAKDKESLGPFQAALTKAGMLTFITGMCISLPLSLLPPYLLYKAGILSRTTKERASLHIGNFCARWMLRLVPFARLSIIADDELAKVPSRLSGKRRQHTEQQEEPSIWVCNHVSMLDVFFLMAAANKMVSRPIKVLYWKQLEANPVSKALFTMCGFIPVQMEDNGNGQPNSYDRRSFRALIQNSKQAFAEGFDLGILPEGQLNPHPEAGLLPVFSGAYSLSKMSGRPIRMIALHGTHCMWHANQEIGMKATRRHVKVRLYPKGRVYGSSGEFVEAFEKVVGYFGAHGRDLEEQELRRWVGGGQKKE